MSSPLIENRQELSDECFARLKICFGNTEPISDIRLLGLSDGRNHDRHVKVLVGEQWFGFKTYPEAERKGENHRKYAEQDHLISKIAESLVYAPNACPMRQVTDFEHSLFRGWTVNIVQWLPDSDTFDRLDVSLIQSLTDGADEFFFEFGQWLAFGLAMGVQDRRVDQFVCSRSRKIAMIDMDYCFVAGGANYQNYVDVLRIFRMIPADRLQGHVNQLIEGMEQMNRKIDQSRGLILDMLRGALHSDLSSKWNPVSNLHTDVNVVAEAVFSSLS